MTSAIRIDRTGGPEVLTFGDVERATPGPGQAWIEHEAIGVNYLDVTQRNGAIPIKLPSGLGLEGAGKVTAVGGDVRDIAIGDRVGYALGPIGSYATGRLYPAERLVRLPDDVSCSEAAAIIFKGITAQYLIKSTFAVQPGHTVLLYGVAGAVGQILAPWARHLGARVIGVVSKEASVKRAMAAGCDSVVVWNDKLPEEVADLTNGRKVDVVYDGIGRTTFAASLESLRPRGTMVSIGASSGVPPAVELATLNAKSLFLTRPGLGHHVADVAEYHERVRDVFAAMSQGVIKPSTWKTFALADAAEAHAALETGKSAGAIVLKP